MFLLRVVHIHFTCSLSYSSSQVPKTSEHWLMTFSNSSKEMNMRRLVLSTLRSWLERSLEMASTRRRALWIGYLVLRILRRWEKMA